MSGHTGTRRALLSEVVRKDCAKIALLRMFNLVGSLNQQVDFERAEPLVNTFAKPYRRTINRDVANGRSALGQPAVFMRLQSSSQNAERDAFGPIFAPCRLT